MASYLQENDYRIYQVTPFLPDKESINRALMYRQNRYDEGVARVQGVYNDMLGLDVSNLENKERLSNYMTEAKAKLNKFGKADFSIQDNIQAATNVFEPITKDRYILNDVATTKFFRNQFKVAEEMKSKNKGDGYNQTNLRYVQNAYGKFINAKGDEQFQTEQREYTPYVDVMSEINEVAAKMKVDVVKDVTAPGGYIVKQKNGSIAYGALRDLFTSNLSSAARSQLKIESTVGYEDAASLIGEDRAAAEMSARYADSLTRQKSGNEKILANLDRTISEIEALGDKATIQQKEYLENYQGQRDILSANIKGASNTLSNMNTWTPTDKIKYAKQLANEMYVESRAHNWARSYADATASTTIDKDDSYWTAMEYNRNILKDNRDYELALFKASKEKSEKDKAEKDDKTPPDPRDPGQWTKLGNASADKGEVNYESIANSQVAAHDNLENYKRAALDEYWDKKGGNGSGMYSAISKAISNGNRSGRVTDLVKAYNSDPDLRNKLSLDDYGKVLGVSGEAIDSMTIQEAYSRMNAGFNEYLKNAESVPSGDLNPYRYKLGLQQRQEVYDYYKNTRDDINKQTASNFKFNFLPGSKTLTEKSFINSDGSLKLLSQVKKDLGIDDSVKKVSNTDNQSVRIGRANPRISGFGSESPAIDTKSAGAIEQAYNNFAKAYNKERNVSARTLSKNIEFSTYSAENDPKETNDIADQVSRKLVYNFNGVNKALFADQFTKDELEILQKFDTNTNSLVASVEMTPKAGGGTDYSVKFSPDKLVNGKYIDEKSSAGKALIEKLANGVVFKDIKNIPELEVTQDITRFLVDGGKPVERSFGDKYNFRIKKIGLDNPSYIVQGTRYVPETTSDGKLIKDNGIIRFKQERIEETLDPTKNNLDQYLNNLSDLFYQMNAIYIYSQRADIINKADTDPGAIVTKEQLINGATQEYKLKTNR